MRCAEPAPVRPNGSNRDIEERTFQFACRVIDVCDLLIQRGGIAARLAFQLFSSATSVGANLEEATGAISKRDFAAKAGVSLKEARESLYWLRLIAAKIRPLPTDVTALQNESHELVAILTVIVRNAQHSAEWRE